MPYRSGRRCSAYGEKSTDIPSATRMGDSRFSPPPTGNVVAFCAVRELIGTGGYSRKAIGT
jgi:hypothetical protein